MIQYAIHFGGGCIDIVYLESLFWRLFSIDLFFTYQKKIKNDTICNTMIHTLSTIFNNF